MAYQSPKDEGFVGNPGTVLKPAGGAAHAHQLYDNEVLAVKLEEIIETYLRAQDLMTIDNSLVEAAGMWKTINTYKYSDNIKEVAMGEGNDDSGIVTLEAINYEVKVFQQKFTYRDEEIMRDPRVLDTAIDGMAKAMVNHLNGQFFAALSALNTLDGAMSETVESLGYDQVVDALAKFANVKAANENEAGLFLLINHKQRAELRKDEDFVSAQLGKIVIDGQIGSIAGVPIVASKSVPEGKAYLMTKQAVTCFVKKSSEVEQEREANKRTNHVYGRKVNLVAVTDATQVVEFVITPKPQA